MKINWDISEIRNNIAELKHLQSIETSLEKQEAIAWQIQKYQDMLCTIYRKQSNAPILDTEKMNLDEVADIFFENTFLKKDYFLIDLLVYSWPIIQPFHEDESELTTIICNNQQLIQKTESFLKKYTTPNIYQQYLTFKQQNPHYLQIKKDNWDLGYSGLTYIDYILKKKYVLLLRSNTFYDLVTLPHELFHVLFDDFNHYLTLHNQIYYSHEVEGSFANFLAIDFYEQTLPEISLEAAKTFLSNYKDNIYSLIIGSSYLQAINFKKQFRLNKFNKILNFWNAPIPTSIAEIKNYMSSNCGKIINYALSYLASLDLFEIYKKDPEFAFYLLGNIRYSLKEDNILKILRRNHITFMDDNFTNLKAYVKKIERQ